MYSKGAIFQAVSNFQNCSNFCANNNTAFGQCCMSQNIKECLLLAM